MAWLRAVSVRGERKRRSISISVERTDSRRAMAVSYSTMEEGEHRETHMRTTDTLLLFFSAVLTRLWCSRVRLRNQFAEKRNSPSYIFDSRLDRSAE